MEFEFCERAPMAEVMGSEAVQLQMESAETISEQNPLVDREVATVSEDIASGPPTDEECISKPFLVDETPVPVTLPLTLPLLESSEMNPPLSAPPAPSAPITNLQIVTRKRSSLAAALPASTSVSPPQDQENGQEAAPHPPSKKKKKYIPKPKKEPAEPKPKKSSAAPKPKVPGQSKSKSKKSSTKVKTGMDNLSMQEAGSEITAPGNVLNQQPQPPMPPLRLQLPKLTKIPTQPDQFHAQDMIPEKIEIKEEPQDYDNEDQDESSDYQHLVQDVEGGSGGKPSRKKKSKGRNGNIYIGVFNRIEWMKLQDQFGFQSVNNFGTFVLQTMRRIYGDISFCCDLAKASGIYSELDKYVWKNGFPHAISLDGEPFAPPEVELGDEKRDQVVELAKSMWEQRLQQLELEQQLGQQNFDNGGGPGGSGLIVIPEDGEEDDEEDAEDPALGNYIENMANNEQYTPEDVVGDAIGEEQMTSENVSRIWNEQIQNVQNIEQFGKLVSFINSIQQPGLEENGGAFIEQNNSSE